MSYATRSPRTEGFDQRGELTAPSEVECSRYAQDSSVCHCQSQKSPCQHIWHRRWRWISMHSFLPPRVGGLKIVTSKPTRSRSSWCLTLEPRTSERAERIHTRTESMPGPILRLPGHNVCWDTNLSQDRICPRTEICPGTEILSQDRFCPRTEILSQDRKILSQDRNLSQACCCRRCWLISRTNAGTTVAHNRTRCETGGCANYGKLATVLAVVEGGIDTQGCASDVLPVIA